MGKSLILILVSVTLGVSGQLCLKAGMDQVGTLAATSVGGAVQTALRVLTTPLVFLGLASYALSAVFWLVVLSKLDLSLAYPMLALTYILIPLAAHFVLGEQMPAQRWLGVGIIFVGVLVVAQTWGKIDVRTPGQLAYYLQGQSTSLTRYGLEQTLYALLGWLPGIVGIGLRGVAYKLILESKGLPVIEHGVRLAQPANIHLGRGVYIDDSVYLHACPDGIYIGDGSFIMHGSVLHVFNFRDLPHAGIKIGRKCFVGEMNVIRGQGGVTIGNYVYTGSLVQILAVNHVFEDHNVPIMEQGITARGIVIEDDVWLASGVIVLDGAHVGRGSVVGAGSVVADDLPPYSIAVGSPARVVRDRREAREVKQSVAAHVHFGDLERIR